MQPRMRRAAAAGNAPDGFDFSGLPEDFDPSSLPEEFSGGFSAPPSSGQTETTPAADSATAEDAGASRPSGRRGAGTGWSVPLKLDGDFFFLAGRVDLDWSFGRHSGYRLDHRQEIQKLMG